MPGRGPSEQGRPLGRPSAPAYSTNKEAEALRLGWGTDWPPAWHIPRPACCHCLLSLPDTAAERGAAELTPRTVRLFPHFLPLTPPFLTPLQGPARGLHPHLACLTFTHQASQAGMGFAGAERCFTWTVKTGVGFFFFFFHSFGVVF